MPTANVDHAGAPSPAPWVRGAREASRALAHFFPAMPGEVTVLQDGTLSELAARHGHDVVVVAFTLSSSSRRVPFALVLDAHGARVVTARLLRLPASTSEPSSSPLSRGALSALAELGNIVASAYANGVASEGGGPWLPSLPRVLEGNTSSVLEEALEQTGRTVWCAALVEGVHVSLCVSTG
jgi:chemotaxis protein CheY-P-specific phosphatase CheC